MYTKISLIKRTVFYLLCFSFFLTSCNNSGLDYTIKTILNPNKISPLTAILNITSDIPCKATVKVLGDIPVEQSFDASSTSLIVPVLGLYPNKLNQVEITLDYEGGQKIDSNANPRTSKPQATLDTVAGEKILISFIIYRDNLIYSKFNL